MQLYKTRQGIIISHEENYYQTTATNWDEFINRDNLYEFLTNEIATLQPKNDLTSLIESNTLPPVQSQEIWAAGVTYMRSMKARMEESKVSGGDTFYDKVYEAERPDIN